ncbi:hypothetical protein GCM10010104_45610 [Streptomyces indiaensis]|uniref:Uncharacterized protein n=1 Tax=Streptomyces indiaensis TaxID=284033 RepID=A0ABP5QX90_9ACTN
MAPLPVIGESVVLYSRLCEQALQCPEMVTALSRADDSPSAAPLASRIVVTTTEHHRARASAAGPFP